MILPLCHADPVVQDVPLVLMHRVTRFPWRADSERATAKSARRSLVVAARRLLSNMVRKLGPANFAKMATMAITIISSINVKPDCLRDFIYLPLFIILRITVTLSKLPEIKGGGKPINGCGWWE
jgi:hypothetical protein